MDGESVTEAAHIIPFSRSHNDDVRNGISLCKLHHWAFDSGLISLSKTYKVIVSELMSEQGPTERLLSELSKQLILLPDHNLLYPAQDALEWHREKVLRR
jgi:putative restriction endonuclease